MCNMNRKSESLRSKLGKIARESALSTCEEEGTMPKISETTADNIDALVMELYRKKGGKKDGTGVF